MISLPSQTATMADCPSAMLPKNRVLLPISLLLASCVMFQHHAAYSSPPLPHIASKSPPGTIDPGTTDGLAKLTDGLLGKRAIFIGEIHDRVGHHRNQLDVIRALHQRHPDMAIGMEYFQKTFQPWLDDFIAGRIDERQMLRSTEYFKRWKLDYRLIQPILLYAREHRIPLLALNVSDEIHYKVFRGGMDSLDAQELKQVPKAIRPASEHYRQHLQAIFNSHPSDNTFENFMAGVLLWDQYMADVTSAYLKAHPQAKVVVLAGMSHVMYGNGIPERVDLALGGNRSAVLINGDEFGKKPGIADYHLATASGTQLPKAGMLGVSIIDAAGGARISDFSPDSAAQSAGIAIGDLIIAINDARVTSLSDLKSLLFDKLPGDRMRVTIQRAQADTRDAELQFDVALR